MQFSEVEEDFFLNYVIYTKGSDKGFKIKPSEERYLKGGRVIGKSVRKSLQFLLYLYPM